MDFLLASSYWKNDPRVVDLPLIDSAYKIPLIIFAYLYFVLVCGPRFMKNRPPYSLKTFIQLYNIIQVVANSWIVYSFWQMDSITKDLLCPVKIDYTSNPTTQKLIRCAWGYFLLKLLDLIETPIFVLRKKDNQVSGLHLYHHVTTLLVGWFALRYYCFAAAVFITTINCGVHVIMYTYYYLAACGPEIKNIIGPMKRWITIIQIVQFCFIILYVSQNFIPYCEVVSHWPVIIFTQNLLINFYNFYNFYRKTYTKSRKIQ